jgi:hypothetical protein
VWIDTERRKNVTLLPLTFVHREGETAFCYVDRGGRIGRVAVSLGAEGTDDVQVTANLVPNDVVLDAPQAGALLPEGRRWRRALP